MNNPPIARTVRWMVILLSLTISILAPRAATLSWDINSGTFGPQDGPGSWDTTTANWWDGANNVTWTNGDGNSAIFGSGGAGGTVSVGAGTVVANITLNTNYILSGNSLTLTNSGIITAALGTSNLIGSYFAGNVGWTLEGGGIVNHNIGGNDQYTGTVYINNGKVYVGGNDNRQYFSGDVVINTNGMLRYTSGGSGATGGALGGSKILILNGGRVSGLNNTKYLQIHKAVLDNGGGFIQELAGNYTITIATNFDLRDGIMGQANRYTQPTTVKSTSGTLLITNLLYGTGFGLSNLTLNAGELISDKSLKKTEARIVGPLFFAGGSLVASNSTATAGAAEGAITSTTVKPGASTIKSLTSGAAPANGAIGLTAITRLAGGTLNFVTNNSGNAITTTTLNNNDILGGWATYDSADWAAGSPIAPLASTSYQADLNPANWGPVSNVTLNASASANVPDGTSINSLRLTDAATVTLDGTLTLASGGLLVTGSAATVVTNGTLLSGNGSDFVVQQFATGDLTLNSTLADNGSAVSLTKSGPGKLIIAGTNSLSGTNYLNAGAVEVNDLAELAAGPLIMTGGALRYTGADTTENRAITLNGLGGTFDVSNAGTTLTLADNLDNSDGLQVANFATVKWMGNMGGLTKVGDGTLVLTGSNYYNGLTLVAGGTLLINGTNSFDNTTFNAGRVTVSGGVLGGTGAVLGDVVVRNGGTLSPGASPGTFSIGHNLTFESGGASVFDVTNAPGAGDLIVVQGNLSVASGCTITLNIGGTPLTAGTYTLVQYSGKKAGSFNSVPVIASGSIDGSYSIDDNTPGQINLVVVPDVAITTQPQDIVVSTNDPATFSVVATGQAPIHYQWYNYGPLGNSTPTLITDETNTTYTIPSAQSSDSGYYAVVAGNGFNSVTSRLAVLVVGDVLPVISGPSDATVIAGNDHTFSTAVVIANPPPGFQWQTNGVDVSGATTSSLTFNNVQYDLNGTTVSVIASNRVGSVTNSALLTVIVTPTITTQPTNITVNEGDPVTFVSGADGEPAPALQWYKNGAIIGDATNSSYTIGNAQGSDIATYVMKAVNTAGLATSAGARLTVLATNLSTVSLAPANGATGVCYDTPLYVTFNNPISIVNSGRIRIYNSTNPSTPVDTIDMSSNNVVISTLNSGLGIYLTNNIQPRTLFPGDSQAFNYFPVIITGTTAAIYPHAGVLTSNQTYYVTMDNGVVASAGGAYFAGISSPGTWTFTTKPTGPADTNNLVVAADGSGDFVTVQGAVDSIPLNNTTYRLINVRDGNYVEIVNISGKHNITLRGQSRSETVIGYGNNANLTPGGTTHGRMAFKVNGDDIKLERLTVANTTPQGGSQAEALMIESGAARFIMFDCDVESLQDTILANVNSSQGYFYQSRISGNFDYIWGGGNLFFTNCQIYTVPNIYVTNNYNLTASRTDFSTTSNATTHWLNPAGSYTANGISYVNCHLDADPVVNTITLEGANGTANGLASFIGCCIDTNHYVTPSPTILSTYVLWEYGNYDATCTDPVLMGLTVLTNDDPRLLAAGNATNWLYGWSPSLAPNILTNPASLTVNAGDPAAFTVTATGIPDPTYQWLKNGTNVPGATSATFVIPIAHVADGGSYSVVVTTPAGSATSTVATLTVIPHPNTAAPVFTAPADGSVYTLNVGANLSVTNTATDADMPAEAITFSLLSGSGSITPDGIFTWRPQVSDAGTTNVVAVQVSDDGSPSLSATNTFSVIVNPLTLPTLSGVSLAGGQFSLTVGGMEGPDYALQVSTNLALGGWTTILTTNSPPSPFTFTDSNAGAEPIQFYRVLVGPPLP